VEGIHSDRMTEVNQKERAARAWPILVDVALNNRLITYGELARQLDIHHRAVRYVLSEIQDYCLLEKLPPITILVVDQKDGRPGAGFIAWDVNDLEHGLALVYEFPWAAQENPFGFASDGATIQSIADAIVKRKLSPGDAYARVRVRGMAQQVFREVLMKSYGGRCALSGYRTPQLLEAAHIIPWGQATPDQRIDPCNGILLSVLHHRLFDLQWLRIAEDYTVKAVFTNAPVQSPERELLEELDGTNLRLPREQELWPRPDFLRARNKADS
tara:strand:+ start:5351 stop:6163 length:813 start_codon:yes stop_codon:yes gene_type:complete